MANLTNSCVFCKIIAGQSQAAILYHDDQLTAFRDIHPVAPTHILVVPNKHIQSLNEVEAEDQALVGRMLLVARQLASQEKIDQTGYRIILNTGPNGGQTVFHLHLHLIGGQRVRYPMG